MTIRLDLASVSESTLSVSESTLPVPVPPLHPTDLTPADLIQEFKRLEYTVFEGFLNLNLFGIRMPNREGGDWDDYVGALYHDEAGAWFIDLYQATTDPGTDWLLRGNNEAGGTAILCEGQHLSAWVKGLHRQIYPALVQHGAQVPVYRDGTKDNRLDMEKHTIDLGWHGINLHRGSVHRAVEKIGLYSAGCIVVRDPGDWTLLWDLVCASAEKYGDTFSFTLLTWPFGGSNA